MMVKIMLHPPILAAQPRLYTKNVMGSKELHIRTSFSFQYFPLTPDEIPSFTIFVPLLGRSPSLTSSITFSFQILYSLTFSSALVDSIPMPCAASDDLPFDEHIMSTVTYPICYGFPFSSNNFSNYLIPHFIQVYSP